MPQTGVHAKKCNNCGSRFRVLAKGTKAVFCSVRCRVAHHRRVQKDLARNDWHSPPEIVEAARAAMGSIDLDPASCAAANAIIHAEKFYTVKDDGLRQPWFGRVWLNPPYGRHAKKFVRRFAELFGQGAIEQGIVPLSVGHTSTQWFDDALGHLRHSTFTRRGRLPFSGRKDVDHGSIVIGIGIDRDRFGAAFTPLGGRVSHYDPDHAAAAGRG
jgi:hypothetical protein